MKRATTWMNLEDIMPHDISQSRKDKYCAISPMGGSQNYQISRDKVERWFPGAWKSREGESVFDGYRVSVVQDENSLEMDGGDGC